ncbi:MAG: hypothetical protein HN413_02470 [Chloroflexi bacterium]|jgi:hypothetical protein|nr:hypothetical protein [Chloroflexota bacterium]
MLKKLLVPLLILPLMLAACSGETQASLEEAPVAVADAASKVESIVEPVATEAAAESVPGEFTSVCTLVSAALDAPEEYAQLFGVTERDWVYGPETAALTIVEYGDFQ